MLRHWIKVNQNDSVTTWLKIGVSLKEDIMDSSNTRISIVNVGGTVLTNMSSTF